MSDRALRPVLIVEDSEDDYEAMERAFSRNVRLANPLLHFDNGRDALDYIFHRGAFSDLAANPRPLLVLLDLNMPGIDGRQVLQQIKGNEDTRAIPVVILTTSEDEMDVSSSYEAGANTFIKKPVTLPGLTAAIDSLKEYWFEIALMPG